MRTGRDTAYQRLFSLTSDYRTELPARMHIDGNVKFQIEPDLQFVSSRDQGHAKYHAHLPRRHLPTEATVIVRYSSMPLCASAPNPPYSHVEYRDGCEVRGSGRSVPGGNPQHCMEDTSGNNRADFLDRSAANLDFLEYNAGSIREPSVRVAPTQPRVLAHKQATGRERQRPQTGNMSGHARALAGASRGVTNVIPVRLETGDWRLGSVLRIDVGVCQARQANQASQVRRAREGGDKGGRRHAQSRNAIPDGMGASRSSLANDNWVKWAI
ncbi:hypothetical protein CIB48_g7275 [Xylaria polymorpha]|nr:hypothetical protein CIB48_g7275 [Xylaria polymorpha]